MRALIWLVYIAKERIISFVPRLQSWWISGLVTCGLDWRMMLQVSTGLTLWLYSVQGWHFVWLYANCCNFVVTPMHLYGPYTISFTQQYLLMCNGIMCKCAILTNCAKNKTDLIQNLQTKNCFCFIMAYVGGEWHLHDLLPTFNSVSSIYHRQPCMDRW